MLGLLYPVRGRGREGSEDLGRGPPGVRTVGGEAGRVARTVILLG